MNNTERPLFALMRSLVKEETIITREISSSEQDLSYRCLLRVTERGARRLRQIMTRLQLKCNITLI